MIPEIGIVICLYILTQILPRSRARFISGLSILTAVVTVLVVIDLAARGLTSNSLLFTQGSTGSAELLKASSSSSEAPKQGRTSTVTRADGGSITTDLGYGIAIAKGSSLKREWIAIHDSAFPVSLEGTPGVSTVYVSKQYGGDYRYRARFTIAAKRPVRAVEVRFLTFDVWGDHVRTLSFEEVGDFSPGNKDLLGEWSLYSENAVESHYASIAYVARVRLDDGSVMLAPSNAVLEEARKFSEKFTPAQLEPKPLVPAPAPTTRSGS